MPDLIVFLPNHGYSNGDTIYVSWLDDNYFVSDKDVKSFKLATTSGSTLVQFTETITKGYVRKVAVSNIRTITGLDHLEGELVKITSGGNVVGTKVVSGGSVTLRNAVSTYQVGLPYRMKIRTMRLAVPQSGGALQARIKRINETVVRFVRSKGGKAGQEYDNVEYLQDINATYNLASQDTPKNNRLTTGGFTKDAYTVIASDDPFPLTVLSTVVTVEVYK